MSDVVASEWLKLRSVRSTYWLLAALVLLLLGSWGVSHAMVAAWDAAAPAEQANFESIDMWVVVGPLSQLVLAILATLAVTAEYRTGAIVGTLTAVPNRLRLLTAKSLVATGLTVVAGTFVVVASTLLSLQAAGDRPAPIEPWTSLGDAAWAGLAGVATIVSAALVGVGLGAAFRSSAGAVAAISGLLFVAPVVAAYLPDPWNERVFGVLPSSLADQLTGETEYVLGPIGAGVALVAYPAVALTIGAVALLRRDA
ncbi:ABC transporter permease [Cryptosporangium minutisporangium]|uniref:ABC transporter permease n=1 Tax=Cryptosporangium minutisporangium TaxID=113569 RepID=A0ABP6T926_9ACTN